MFLRKKENESQKKDPKAEIIATPERQATSAADTTKSKVKPQIGSDRQLQLVDFFGAGASRSASKREPKIEGNP